MLMICIICVCLLVRFLLTSGGFWGASLKNCRGCKTKYLGIAEVQIDFEIEKRTVKNGSMQGILLHSIYKYL